MTHPPPRPTIIWSKECTDYRDRQKRAWCLECPGAGRELKAKAQDALYMPAVEAIAFQYAQRGREKCGGSTSRRNYNHYQCRVPLRRLGCSESQTTYPSCKMTHPPKITWSDECTDYRKQADASMVCPVPVPRCRPQGQSGSRRRAVSPRRRGIGDKLRARDGGNGGSRRSSYCHKGRLPLDNLACSGSRTRRQPLHHHLHRRRKSVFPLLQPSGRSGTKTATQNGPTADIHPTAAFPRPRCIKLDRFTTMISAGLMVIALLLSRNALLLMARMIFVGPELGKFNAAASMSTCFFWCTYGPPSLYHALRVDPTTQDVDFCCLTPTDHAPRHTCGRNLM